MTKRIKFFKVQINNKTLNRENNCNFPKSKVCKVLALITAINSLTLVNPAVTYAHNTKKSQAETSIPEKLPITTPLHESVRLGKLDDVKSLIENGANVNQPDVAMQTPLHIAMSNNHLDVLRLLLEQGANISVRDYNNKTLLHLATECGNLEAVKILIENGIDVNAVDNKEMTSIDYINSFLDEVYAKTNYRKVTLQLIPLGPYWEIVKLLISNGATFNKIAPHELRLLFSAAEGNRLDVIKLLIEHGANINSKNAEGKTILHLAAENGYLDIVNFSLEQGVNVNVKNETDLPTPLHGSVFNGQLEVIKVLIENGANVIGSNNKSPLGVAIDLIGKREIKNKNLSLKICSIYLSEYFDVVEILLKNGANVNEKGVGDLTALHLAAAYGQTTIIDYLIKHGADVNAMDSYGRTPLYFAAKEGSVFSEKLLIEYCADTEDVKYQSLIQRKKT